MNTYWYWQNKKEWHEKLMFKCEAKTIEEADKMFEHNCGHDPIKCSWISCSALIKMKDCLKKEQ